jgi:hypothetical protein
MSRSNSASYPGLTRRLTNIITARFFELLIAVFQVSSADSYGRVLYWRVSRSNLQEGSYLQNIRGEVLRGRKMVGARGENNPVARLTKAAVLDIRSSMAQ